MGSPKVKVSAREQRKSAIRQFREMKVRMRSGERPAVTVIQDEITKSIVAVLADRNDFSKFQARAQSEGLDLSHCELIDFELRF